MSLKCPWFSMVIFVIKVIRNNHGTYRAKLFWSMVASLQSADSFNELCGGTIAKKLLVQGQNMILTKTFLHGNNEQWCICALNI